jgi:hypothetical protein
VLVVGVEIAVELVRLAVGAVSGVGRVEAHDRGRCDFTAATGTSRRPDLDDADHPRSAAGEALGDLAGLPVGGAVALA